MPPNKFNARRNSLQLRDPDRLINLVTAFGWRNYRQTGRPSKRKRPIPFLKIKNAMPKARRRLLTICNARLPSQKGVFADRFEAGVNNKDGHMLATDQLILDAQVGGSLNETLVLRGSVGARGLLVLFSAEILDHWPPEIQRERLNEMLLFIDCAIRRALAAGRYSIVSEAFTGDREAYLLVLDWKDIAS